MKYQKCVMGWAVLAVATAFLLLPAASAQSDNSLAAARAQKYSPLLADVVRKQASIWSDGTRMAGDLYMPKDLKPGERLPAIVFVHGTSGVKKMAWSIKLAVAFARRGYVFLIVDWAMNPQNKTPNTPPMPSFYFAGQENLMIITRQILEMK